MKKLFYFLLLSLFLISVSSCDYKQWTEKITITKAEVVDFKEGEAYNVAMGFVTNSMIIGAATATKPTLYLKIVGQNDTIPLEVSPGIISDLYKQKTNTIKIKKTSWFKGNEEKEVNYEFISIE
jgi:hypothetical protein